MFRHGSLAIHAGTYDREKEGCCGWGTESERWALGITCTYTDRSSSPVYLTGSIIGASLSRRIRRDRLSGGGGRRRDGIGALFWDEGGKAAAVAAPVAAASWYKEHRQITGGQRKKSDSATTADSAGRKEFKERLKRLEEMEKRVRRDFDRALEKATAGENKRDEDLEKKSEPEKR